MENHIENILINDLIFEWTLCLSIGLSSSNINMHGYCSPYVYFVQCARPDRGEHVCIRRTQKGCILDFFVYIYYDCINTVHFVIHNARMRRYCTKLSVLSTTFARRLHASSTKFSVYSHSRPSVGAETVQCYGRSRTRSLPAKNFNIILLYLHLNGKF